MIGLVMRQLKLYFVNKANLIFSMLGAVISFVLYIIFLQKNITDIWPDNDKAKLVLDWWVIGGTLAITSMTTSWHIALRLISDRASNCLDDLLLTDTSLTKVYSAYFISSSLIAMIMQAIIFTIMTVYFNVQDGLAFDFSKLPALFFMMIVSAMVGAVISVLVTYFIKTIEVGERLSVIIGTMSGFLVGVYMPLGNMPDFALKVIKFIPGAYAAAAYRELLIGKDIDNLTLPGKDLKEFLGLGIKWDKLTNFATDSYLLISVFLVLFFVLLCKVYHEERIMK